MLLEMQAKTATARILPIYEGTNGIQAIDLVTRKLVLESGVMLLRLLESSRLGLARVSGEASASQMVPAVGEMARTISEVPGSPASLAAATPFLRALATTIAGGYLAETAELARGGELEREAENNARYFITVEVPSAIRAASSAVSGAAVVVNAKWSW